MTLKCNKSKPNIFKNGEICENLSFGEVMQINVSLKKNRKFEGKIYHNVNMTSSVNKRLNC